MRASLLFAGSLFAATLLDAAEHAPRPGGIAVLTVGELPAPPPVVHAGERRALVYTHDGSHYAVVGIPLDAEPGATLAVDAGDSRQSVAIEAHSYREQRLNVDRKYVSPSEETLDRIRRERVEIDAALNAFRRIDVPEPSLEAPVDGRRSSSFGLRRFFNDQPRSPHKGMDIAAAEGTPILAPAAGVVTAVGDYYFNGNTVILDHGQGFVTLYCHLSATNVTVGDRLEAGEILGEVGATGRVTGPHLHFATYLGGTAVDPALLLRDAAGD